MQPSNPSQPSPADHAMPELLSFEEYITRFSQRYRKEKPFQTIVHTYLHISRTRRAKLGLARHVYPSWYQRTTDKLVRNYALQVRTELEKALEVKNELLQIQEASTILTQGADDVLRTAAERKVAEESTRETTEQKQLALYGVEQQIETGKRVEEERAAIEQEMIRAKTDAQAIARKKLEERLTSSSLIRVDSEGILQFDEQRIVDRLERLFLQEIIETVEREDGCGFMSKVRQNYEGLFSHHDALEELGELPVVEWVQSIILSRTKGYRLPTFPYFMVQKFEERTRGTLDSAISIDWSGSMKDDNKYIVARKAGLATRALLRKLNPRNETYLSVYSASVRSKTSAELMKIETPENGTCTDFALDWLLTTLTGHVPSLAYLITDGLPNNVHDAIKVAQRFQEHPYIHLRIFLINGDANSEENIRKIGRAAGPNTKVIPIKDYELPGGVLRNIDQSIGEMQSIMSF